jgi:TatD DNase family protein
MSLVDTHTHLDGFLHRGELEAVLARARAAGVEAMIAIGTEPADWILNRDIARAHPGVVSYTAGLHPCCVQGDWAGQLAGLESCWTGPSEPPVALGETGLDRFHLPKEPGEAERIYGWQRQAFAAQLALAKRLGCPVVIHSRAAFADCRDQIDASGVDWAKVVFHCFSEGPAEMTEIFERGGRGSFTGILTYKNAESVRQAATAQGLPRCMVETDAPYLAPAPHRGKPNEPAFLRHTAEYAAALFGVSYAEFAAVTTANARAFFGLPAGAGR